MGLGIAPLQALRTSNGGNGPLTVTAAGTTFATATRLQAAQYFVSVSGAGGSGGAAVSLPSVGSDTGALLADDFVVNNLSAAQTLTVFSSTGVTISTSGSNTSSTSLAIHTSATFYPLSSTQWICVKGS
jgi:hypothetical protein